MDYIYLDDAATTKVDDRVKMAMDEYYDKKYGNPSSLHKMGKEAKKAMKDARERTANILNADSEEIIFTSGGTEADNLAIKGAIEKNEGNHIITTEIEHAAVYNTCKYLEKKGYDVTYLEVDEDGLVDVDEFEGAIRDDTVIASIMYANNEIGTVEPIKKLGEIADENDILFHTDAVQAVGKLTINVKEEKIDMLSLSAHKLHGPKGVGALYLSKDVDIEPIIHGGGHENGYRSGTENVSGIVGLGKACEIAENKMDEYVPKMTRLRDKLIDNILDEVDEAYLNGHREKRLPNNANFYFVAAEGEAIVLHLDSEGIAASTGSACSSKSLKASRTLLATGLDEQYAHCSLRLTLSRYTDEEEIDRAIEVVPEVIADLRDMSPLWDR